MKTVIEFAQKKNNKNIHIYSKYDDLDEVLSELDTPFQSEDGDKPKTKLTIKQKKNLIRQRIQERNADIVMNAKNKFFD